MSGREPVAEGDTTGETSRPDPRAWVGAVHETDTDRWLRWDGQEWVDRPTAEHIVRALAAQRAPMGQCGLCYEDGGHVPTCPWRMAREWVGADA